jgi:hypothetical protein
MSLICVHILFRERLTEACCARNMTETKVCSRIGLGAKRAIHLALAGPQAKAQT